MMVPPGEASRLLTSSLTFTLELPDGPDRKGMPPSTLLFHRTGWVQIFGVVISLASREEGGGGVTGACAGHSAEHISVRRRCCHPQQPPQKCLCCVAIKEAVAPVAGLSLMRHFVSPGPPPSPQQAILKPFCSLRRGSWVSEHLFNN